VMVDRLQVERVISNLVSNALRHTKQGEIKISAERRDSQIAVSVCDTGSGIPTEYLPHIFDKFVQVPDAPTGGAGLGLTISKSIVEAHGGRLGAKSELPVCYMFLFQSTSTLPPERRVHRDTVFIVDDDRSVRDSLSLLVSLRGYVTATFASAEDLIAALKPDWRGCVVATSGCPGCPDSNCSDGCSTSAPPSR